MARIIRRTVKKRGTALIVAVQLTFLTLLSLVSFVNGPQSRDGGTPAVKSSSSAAVASAKEASASSYSSADQTAPDQTETYQAQTQTAQPLTAKDLTAADKEALRASAIPAKKLYEPRASQVFHLATRRAESQAAQRSAQESES